MDDNKRKLEEIIAIYQLEEELVDIYVEGPSDKFIINNYLEYKQQNKTVIEIDLIDLTETQSKFPDLDLKSNKDKLIALSRIFSQNEINSKVKCIIDRDFDGILNPIEENKNLSYTDFSCMESYLFSQKHIEKVINIGIRNFPHNVNLIIEEISKVLYGLFMLRIVSKKYNLNYKFPKIENNLNIDKGTGYCKFNFESYLDLFITTNRLLSKRLEIKEFVKKMTNILQDDYRYNMNGHDFIEVLFNYINKIKNTPNYRLENFERTVFVAIQPNYLDEYDLFKKLID